MKAHYGSIRKSEEQSFEDSISTSRFRCLAAQCCGVFASNCLKFTSSTFVGFHIILIAELHKQSAEIPVTLDQLTWLASLNFLVPIGSIGNGFITQKIGNRFMMLVSSISFVAIWLTYYNATSITQVMAARILYSLTSGALKTSVGTYITEIAQPQLRGCFLATYHLAATFGSFFSLLLGSLVPWRTIALVNMTFPVVSILMVFLIPDSPYWLASKGRLRDAKESLCWLRGWTKPSGVRSEYRSLVEHFERSSLLQDRPVQPSETEPTPQPPAPLGRKERLKAFIRPYLQRSFYLPFGSMTLVYLLYYLSGSTTVQTYSMVIFSKMDSPLDDSVATAWMGAMRVVGAFVVLFSISAAGKRRLLFGSLGLAFVCFLLIGCAELLPANDLNPWLPPLAMILAVFGNASGVDSVVHMLNSEIYPASMRYIGSAIGSSVSSVMGSLMNKFFLYIVDAISLPGVFLLFATMNLAAIVVYNGIVPETEGRSLQEIQDHYGGVKSLDESRATATDRGVDDTSGKTRVTQV